MKTLFRFVGTLFVGAIVAGVLVFASQSPESGSELTKAIMTSLLFGWPVGWVVCWLIDNRDKVSWGI